jgi:hypothetical protein
MRNCSVTQAALPVNVTEQYDRFEMKINNGQSQRVGSVEELHGNDWIFVLARSIDGIAVCTLGN